MTKREYDSVELISCLNFVSRAMKENEAYSRIEGVVFEPSKKGVAHRIDIFEAEQFLAGNLYELGKFAQQGRRTTAEELIFH